ncbi:MAG: hypothetical protein AAFN79_04760 [Pseudomonadota bacterium]
MLTKVAIFLAVLVGVFVVARMGAASAAQPKGGPKSGAKKSRFFRRKGSEELIPCATCGAYIPRGETCICRDAPTP